MKKIEIIYKNVSEIIPYENNPRKNDEAVLDVEQSIKEFDFKVPILLDKNNVIIAGHTRLKAALKLGLAELPCIMADDLTEEQVKRFRIADNRVTERAEWDIELLKIELADITGFTGFTDADLEELFFENVAYKESEPKDKPTEMIMRFEKPEDFRKMEDDLRALIEEKYKGLSVVISSGEQ